MSGQRHLRLAALVIGALGAARLLWLALDVARRGPASGWWLEAAFYGLMILAAVRLRQGSDLAWFGAVVLYACAVVVGTGTVIDLVLSIRAPEPASLLQTAPLLAAGIYGLWALLVSARVKAFRAAHDRPDRFALLTSLAVAVAIAAGIGWYLDRLSPAIQRTIGVQAGIAAAFVVLVAFLAARNRNAPIRWHYLPLVVAGVVVVANLEAIGQLRELRPAAAALSAKPPKSDEELAAALPGKAFRMTTELEAAKREALARLEAHTAVLGPWPLMDALTPPRINDPAAVDAAAAALAARTAEIRGAVKTYDTILGRFADRRRGIVAPLAEPLRRRVEARFGREEDAYRSHYGARVDLLSRAAADLGAMLAILKDQRYRYTADWHGAVAFEDAAAGEDFTLRRASLEELAVWNARLRAEGADLAAGKPAWGWINALD